MVAMNPGIILAGQQPNVMGGFGQGLQLGQMQNEFQHQNALRAALQEHGAGLVQGNQASVNALAGYDPALVMGVQNQQSQIQDREARLNLAYEQANQQAMQMAMQMSDAQRQHDAQVLERALAGGTQAQTPEQWDQIMRSMGADEYVGQFERRDVIIASALGVKDALAMGRDEGTTGFQTRHQQAIAGGLQPGTPQYQQYMLEGSGPQTVVNVGGEQGPRTGTIPPGYMLVEDANAPGGMRMERIAGGPAEEEAMQAERQAEGRQVQTARAGSTVIQDLQRALDLLPELGAISGGGGVIGGVARSAQQRVPGSVVNRITQFTESALSNVGLDTLQQMRENSPTGGALGQVPIQQQQRLEQVLGSLDVTQPPDVLEANIKRVINIYTEIIYGSPEERARAVAEGRMTPEQSQEIDSFYYPLPFDERGRPVQQPQAQPMQPQQMAPAQQPAQPMQQQGAVQAAPEQPAAGQYREPTPEALERYMQFRNPDGTFHPEAIEIFETAYGPGSAARYLMGQGQQQGGQGMPRVTTEEEYRALPSGTEFIAPDGTIRRVP